MRTLGVVMAMRAEAHPLLDALGASPVDAPTGCGRLPTRWYEAQRSGLALVIAVNGVDPRHGVDAIGTQPAALATFATCGNWPLDLVISAGVAGGWARCGGAVGDVYVSRDRFVFHDRRVDLPGFDRYAAGSYPAVDAAELARDLGLKEGVVTTGNSLDESDDDRRVILESGACVKDMEAAAVADVAGLMGVPVMAVKAITDLVDSHVDTVEQFTANLALATSRLRDSMLAVVDWCAGRTVAELGGAEA